MLLYLRSINILLAKEHKNIPYMQQQKNTPVVLITLFQICCHLGRPNITIFEKKVN